ncbi:MAG: ABC transporter permease [Salinivirgaceae bacterium]|jgi:putative ABC transport system permease protein|nr:ABC transporter permease [Salinivirgaceae bacterium]
MYYLKHNLVKLHRNKLTSSALLFSLVVGFTAFIAVFSYILYEKSYDTHFPDNENIYRIVRETYSSNGSKIIDARCERKLGQTLVGELPHVLSSGFLFHPSNPNYKINEAIFSNQNVYHASKELLDVLSINIIQKKSKTLLSEPYKAIISKSTAKKYFDDQNPLGQTFIKYPGYSYEIEGIFEDIPKNTHFEADMFLSFHNDMHLPPPVKEDWGEPAFYTYIRIDANTDITTLENEINKVVSSYKKSYFDKSNMINKYYVQPITSIHLKSNLQGEMTQNANGNYLNILFVVGLLLLIASVFNYVYYTYSHLLSNIKIIGIKKVLGSNLRHFLKNFLAEALIIHVIAIVVSVFICIIIKDPLFQLLKIDINLSFSNSAFWLSLASMFLFSILITGILPVLYVMRRNSLDLIHSKRKKQKISFQHIITVGQFAIIILIIINVLGIDKQLDYLKAKNNGLDIANKLIVRVPQNLHKKSKRVNNIEAFEQELIKYAGIQSISNTSTVPGDFPSFNFTINEKGKPNNVMAGVFITDKSFLDMYNITLEAGSNFSENESETKECIINQMFLKQLGYTSSNEAIGRTLDFQSTNEIFQATIKGVTTDYNFKSMKQLPTPIVLLDWTKNRLWGYYAIELNQGQDIAVVRDFVANQFSNTFPNYPFEYFWLEDHYNEQYSEEFLLTTSLKIFVMLVILVSIINLFSMVWYNTMLRTKEIGIRKVNGATALAVFKMLNFDYLKWIALASLITMPIAYYILSNWLAEFPYHTTISWWIFALALSFTLLIGLLTTSWQTLKLANMNPVISLRDE